MHKRHKSGGIRKTDATLWKGTHPCASCASCGQESPRRLLGLIFNFLALQPFNFIRLSRSEFVITETELRLIAAAEIIGLSRMPKRG